MIIKASLEEHLGDIQRIEESSFPDPWSRASLEAEFMKDYTHIYVYIVGGETAGFIIFSDVYNEAEIITVAVDKEFRLRGIGGALLHFSFELLPERLWFLEVRTDNLQAISLYKQNGFVQSGLIKNYYGQGADAYRMVRHHIA